MRRFHKFSGGVGSFRASMIDRLVHPDAEHRLLFTDTLYEDADTYRFLVEAAAVVLRRRLNWTVKAAGFPDYRVPDDVPIEEYRGNPEWRACLADLRQRTMDALPEMVWLVEGRDPWEVFRDRRFLGNSLRDPCSRILKRECGDAWIIGNCHRVGELFGDPDHFTVGISIDERHRFDDGNGGGLLPRYSAEGWLYHAPLIDAEIMIRDLPAGAEWPREIVRLLYGDVEDFGLATPRLYGQGYKHGNCGGFCVKAGQAHYQNRFTVQPERYAYDAMMERKMAVFLGTDVSMLTDRTGGEKKLLTLDAFAERLRADPSVVYEYAPGDSGCGCMTDPT